MALHDRPQTEKNHTFWQSFRHAASGVGFAVVHERNLRRDLIIAAIVFIAAYFLRIQTTAVLWLILSIFLVLQAELWNSVAEYLVDLSTDHQYAALAKIIKDLSAGIVLLTALFAVIVGLIILGPALWQLVVTH